jgi:hypothetical protein
LGTAFAERLLITPSEPWSSFINGGAQPASNVGPWLLDGMEFRVWSDTLGAYTYHRQDGRGIIPGTLSLSALQGTATPKTAVIFDASGNPATVSGVPGQVLTAGPDGTPQFATPATGSYFTVRLLTSQDYATNNTPVQIQFNNTGACQNVIPDSAGYRVPVPANSVWFFRVSAQINHINGVTPDWEHFINIRPYQDNSLVLGSNSANAVAAGLSRSGVAASGIYAFGGAGYVDVTIAATSSVTGNRFQVDNNGGNTIFSGFRIF